MRFKFCGDTDCQDWLLAQIILISKLSSIKLKVLLKEVTSHILNEQIDFSKACKLTSDAKLDEDETKAILAALNYIITSSARYDTDSETVSNELQQLGLPREHCTALCKIYSDNLNNIKQKLTERSLKFFPLKQVSYDLRTICEHGSWLVDCPSIFLNFVDQRDQSTSIYVQPEKLDCLIRDMKEALQIMQNTEI